MRDTALAFFWVISEWKEADCFCCGSWIGAVLFVARRSLGSALVPIFFILYTQPPSDIIERHSSSCPHSLYRISLNVTLHPVHTASIWYHWTSLFILSTQPLSDITERHSSSCPHSLYLISLNTTLHPVHTASIWYHWTSLFILSTQPLSDIIEHHCSSCTHSLYLILNVTLLCITCLLTTLSCTTQLLVPALVLFSATCKTERCKEVDHPQAPTDWRQDWSSALWPYQIFLLFLESVRVIHLFAILPVI